MSWVDKPFAPWIPLIVVAMLCAAMLGGAYGYKRGLSEHYDDATIYKVFNVEE